MNSIVSKKDKKLKNPQKVGKKKADKKNLHFKPKCFQAK